MKELHMLTYSLIIVGALNWGLVGALDINLVGLLFGGYPSFEKASYILVGVSAIAEVVMHSTSCNWCEMKKPKSKKGKR